MPALLFWRADRRVQACHDDLLDLILWAAHVDRTLTSPNRDCHVFSQDASGRTSPEPAWPQVDAVLHAKVIGPRAIRNPAKRSPSTNPTPGIVTASPFRSSGPRRRLCGLKWSNVDLDRGAITPSAGVAIETSHSTPPGTTNTGSHADPDDLRVSSTMVIDAGQEPSLFSRRETGKLLSNVGQSAHLQRVAGTVRSGRPIVISPAPKSVLIDRKDHRDRAR
jgi:hypothetical protein